MIIISNNFTPPKKLKPREKFTERSGSIFGWSRSAKRKPIFVMESIGGPRGLGKEVMRHGKGEK
jgi:hypothetical protein